MVFKTRAITPKKLKDQVIRKALLDEVRSVADDVLKDYRKTTKTWKKKPKFEKLFQLSAGTVAFLVGTDNEIYRFVDEGTDPHVILPRRAKALRFQSGYTAKTTPRVIGSKKGGPSGNTIFSKGVLHPGTKAREFSKEIAEKWETEFQGRMQNALDEGAKASGHSI